MFNSKSSEFYIELRSFDCLNLYPMNIASCFRVQFIRELKFNGDWQLSLRDLVINCKDTDNIGGRDIYIYTNIIEMSFVGTNLRSVLRRVNSGQGVRNGSRLTYLCKTEDCYRAISVPYCMSLEIRIEDEHGHLLNLSALSTVSMTLHFRRTV